MKAVTTQRWRLFLSSRSHARRFEQRPDIGAQAANPPGEPWFRVAQCDLWPSDDEPQGSNVSLLATALAAAVLFSQPAKALDYDTLLEGAATSPLRGEM